MALNLILDLRHRNGLTVLVISHSDRGWRRRNAWRQARIKAERNEAMMMVATGDVASLFHGATAAIDHFDPDLAIRGLLEIYPAKHQDPHRQA